MAATRKRRRERCVCALYGIAFCRECRGLSTRRTSAVRRARLTGDLHLPDEWTETGVLVGCWTCRRPTPVLDDSGEPRCWPTCINEEVA
jgi:hypothetical protein